LRELNFVWSYQALPGLRAQVLNILEMSFSGCQSQIVLQASSMACGLFNFGQVFG